jgi:hypothetical protein
VSIVGAGEVDRNRNHISWVSPGGTEYLDVLEVLTSAFQWNRSVSRLDPSPPQRDLSPSHSN